jgi:hypothetical protein
VLVVGLLAAASSRAAEPVDFAHDVLPLLREHCAKCHSNGRYEGSVSFDTRAALLEAGAAEPGNSADSILVDRITSDDADYRMPAEGPPLSKAEIDVFRRWIDAGLPWQEGFSFRADKYDAPLGPRRPDLPPAEDGVSNPLDRIVFAYWRAHGVTPPPALSDAAFYRRASLDLVGMLPDPAALEAFAADADPLKRQRLVRGLLDDRVAYADHWLTFWNDLLRNAYKGTGYINGGRTQITAWLYRALLENMPYDRFVRELVNPTPASAGFAKGFVWRGTVNASQRPELQFSQNVGQVFLGVNLKCASCHDSFIDDWKLTDAYGLAAIWGEEPLEIHRCDVPTGKIAQAHFLFSELGEVDPQLPRQERLRRLAELMTSADNGRLTRTIVNRLWDRLLGRGVVFPVDVMAARPWSEDLLDYLAVHLSDSDYDLKQTLELIATSQVYGLESISYDPTIAADEFVFAAPGPKRMTAEQFVDAIVQLTGLRPESTETDPVFNELMYYATSGTGTRPFVRAALVNSTPLMRTLGRPNREQVVTTRPSEMTTLEALELSNGRPLAKLLRQGAERLLAEHPDLSSAQMCGSVFRLALSRPATDEELARLTAMAGEPPTAAGLGDMLWCVIMLPEFQIVR